MKTNFFVNTFDWRGLRCMTPGMRWWLQREADARRPWQQWETAQRHYLCNRQPSAWETERALSLRTPRAQQGLCHFTSRAPEITPLLMLKIKLSFHWRMWWLESCFVFTFFSPYSFPSRGSWEKVPGSFKAWQVDRQEWVQRVTHSCLRSSWSYRQIPVDWKQESDSPFHMIRVIPQVENYNFGDLKICIEPACCNFFIFFNTLFHIKWFPKSEFIISSLIWKTRGSYSWSKVTSNARLYKNFSAPCRRYLCFTSVWLPHSLYSEIFKSHAS